MGRFEDRLAAIGFDVGSRPALRVWRVERRGCDPGRLPAAVADIWRHRDFAAWLDTLRDRPGPPVYRIRRTR